MTKPTADLLGQIVLKSEIAHITPFGNGNNPFSITLKSGKTIAPWANPNSPKDDLIRLRQVHTEIVDYLNTRTA
ncbi:MAG: hypothetical protein WAX89_02620 [Alphaproteobacteria bacterium]